MQVLSADQATRWCEARGVHVNAPGYPHYAGGDFRCIEVRAPAEGRRLLALGYSLLMTGVREDEEQNFAGCLLWLRDCDLWSETFDRVGHVLLEGLRRRATRAGELYEAPALLFAPGEIADAQAALMLPTLFQWDAVVVPASGDHIAYVSHDEVVQIVTRTTQTFEDVFDRLEEGNWVLKERACPDYLLSE